MNFTDILNHTKLRINRTTESEISSAAIKHGFIHIGKTGGTSLGKVNSALKDNGHTTLRIFDHSTTLAKAADENPNYRFSFMIRDPIERIVSGFNSRMRQSRPSYTALWKPEEAICYQWFPTVHDFFDALLSNDERMKSAGLFGLRHMGHVHRGFTFHFGSLETLARYEERIYFVGRLERGDTELQSFFKPLDIPRHIIEEYSDHHHSGGDSTMQSLTRISDTRLQELKSYFHKEYEIYDHLLKLAAKFNP